MKKMDPLNPLLGIPNTVDPLRIQLNVTGRIQGVGFRPAIYRLANRIGLGGWVQNNLEGARIELEGTSEKINNFISCIKSNLPRTASVNSLKWASLPRLGESKFYIRRSQSNMGRRTAALLPDLNICADCLQELFDPKDRRYRYPFINCTQCGPRFSIMNALPYDRANTTMANFEMCGECRAEYEDPRNRRFHAQPNACSQCGPRVSLWNQVGHTIYRDMRAIQTAAASLKAGQIVGLKGLGGFQLLVDAQNNEAVKELRQRKRRDEKPFAMMVANLEMAFNLVEHDPLAEAILSAPSGPIVLLPKKNDVAPLVAPDSAEYGIMLPTTPLHALLMAEVGRPLVATSGNISEEPICIDEQEAVMRLGGLVDLFLVHDRPIARAMDDSVVRMVLGRPLVLRAGRGLAPIEIPISEAGSNFFAVGAHQKNTFAYLAGDHVLVSPHIGDLNSPQSESAFLKSEAAIREMLNIKSDCVVRDCHPDYRSSQLAEKFSKQCEEVPHHHAHMAAAMLDNGLTHSALGVIWDGSGLGEDGTLWGGEFLSGTISDVTRVASFREFPLPGGEKAAREPRRSALGMAYAALGSQVFDYDELWRRWGFGINEKNLLFKMLQKKINCPMTSSVGRLFDGMASLLGICQVSSYEGQAPKRLEQSASEGRGSSLRLPSFPLLIGTTGLILIDWVPFLRRTIKDLTHVVSADMSFEFHRLLANAAADVYDTQEKTAVVLSGGCFQNRILLEKVHSALNAKGARVFWPRRHPPNDGGISLGQIAVSGARWKATHSNDGPPNLNNRVFPEENSPLRSA